MARPSPYSESQKATILEAVKSARKTGTWGDALKAAHASGFKGGLPYLQKFAGGGKRRGKLKASKTGGKLGRPKGSKNVVKRGMPARGAVAGAGLGQIDAVVRRMVEERVSISIGRAVKALEVAAAELKAL